MGRAGFIGHRRACAAALALAFSCVLGGCVATTSDSRFRRHLCGPVWTGALAEQWQDPWRAVPEGTLAVTSLALIPFDDDIQDELGQRNPSSEDELPGDILMYSALTLPVAWGGVAWARGDDGKKFETSLEALGVTAATVYALKALVHRERPDGNGSDSFPSGHSAAAFYGATMLANFIEQDTPSHSKLGYLLYLPAAYVGINRIQTDRHYATDVAVGAFLGTFIPNLIFDAHYGDEKRDHEGIFTPPRQAHWSVGAQQTEHGTAFLLRLDF